MNDPINTLSLLWPEIELKNSPSNIISQDNTAINDLGLEELAKFLSLNNKHSTPKDYLLKSLTDHPEVIRYRHDIIEDILNNPGLETTFKNLLNMMDELSTLSIRSRSDEIPLIQVISRLSELDVYIKCIHDLNSALSGKDTRIHSRGLLQLKSLIDGIMGDTTFQSLIEELPALKARFGKVSSVTIGLNLDDQFYPKEGVIVSVNDFEYKDQSIFSRLLSSSRDKDKQCASKLIKVDKTKMIRNGEVQTVDSPFHVMLFKELNSILGSIAKPIAVNIGTYAYINSRFLVDLKAELIFLLGAVKLIHTIHQTRLPMCRPEISPKENRAFEITELFNINLALNLHHKNPSQDLKDTVVTNDVDFSDSKRLFILTGPNRGGKTTFTQAIGQSQFLFQLGFYIPASHAVMSPVDGIYTHFPVEEKPDSNLGRLGEESKRLNTIFHYATKYSLILLNESISSTSPGESLYISREILYSLKLLGARAVFATHLHDLAVNLDYVNSQVPGDSKVVSLVSGVANKDGSSTLDSAKRTYKISPAPPQGFSFARDIATRYGISFHKLVETMKSRHILDQDVDYISIEQFECK